MTSSHTNTFTTITIYGKTICPSCNSSKMFLKKNNIDFEYISLDDDATRTAFYEKMTKELGGVIMSVPQIWVNGSHIGGYNELVKFVNDLRKTQEESNISFNQEF